MSFNASSFHALITVVVETYIELQFDVKGCLEDENITDGYR